MTSNLELAQAFYGLAASDPVAAARSFLHPGFVLDNPLPANIPFGGRHEGPNGFLAYLQAIDAAIEMGPLHFDEWVADAGSVVVRGHEQSKVRCTGRSYDMRFVHWLHFDAAGLITAMLEFNDTAAMAAAFD